MNDAGRILIGPASRDLRRALRPIEWVVLEDVALDARPDDAGQLVAPTSARRVAEHLGLTPGAVARALTRLRSVGLVTHARRVGPAGRFGLSTYVLVPVPGLDVIVVTGLPDDAPPRSAPPSPARPHVGPPRVVDAHMVEADAARDQAGDRAGRSRSLHEDDSAAATAAAVRDLSVKTPPRTAAARPSNQRGRRLIAQPTVAQLSILDSPAEPDLDPTSERHQ